MADMQPPPPRYRIVERGGRLIVTDTWADPRSARTEAPKTPMPGTPKPSRPGVPVAPRGARNAGLIDTLGAILLIAACAGSTDGAGTPILTTANLYDGNGPRQIMLGRAGARLLGRVLLAMASALVAMLILMLATSWGFIALFVLVGVTVSNANTTARPAITRWLDRLDQAG